MSWNSSNCFPSPVPGFSFEIHAEDGFARSGTLHTPHGDVETPVFMPVGTQASVKGITRDQIEAIGAEIMLSNTYHLYLRPGDETVAHFGGLHDFMRVKIPILTDSGGFQVFSLGLGKKTKDGEWLVKITEDGVIFRSHLDGSKHVFTPEKAIQIQSNLGSDIVMAFDECAPGDSSHVYAKKAMDRTHRWALRCVDEIARTNTSRVERGLPSQALFPIMQGVVYDDLRIESAKFIGALPTVGMAIWGLSVGESKEDMLRTLDTIAPHLPREKPHYLMGVGTPEDLIEGIYRGIDMFDCVLPTRIGRHGVAYSSYGNIKATNEKYAMEKGGIPMAEGFETMVSRTYSLGYIRHLFKAGEMLAGQLLSLHNLEYLILLSKKSREAIKVGKYNEFREEFWKNYKKEKAR